MDKKVSILIQAYLEKSQQKLRVAGILLKNADYEDAISRAYYSAFHAAHAVLLTEGLDPATHQGLVNLFGLHFVKTGKFERKMGKYLTHLKDDRESSDYEVYSSVDAATAKHALKEAREFLAASKKYLKKIS
ncbi:MAG TPA: HEPN domain-containing protein [bacterium]|nr:HEPN domain-containing protein [bacterium]